VDLMGNPLPDSAIVPGETPVYLVQRQEQLSNPPMLKEEGR
jgi:hypothetical protein